MGWMELGSDRVPDPHDPAPGTLLVGSAASIPSTCLLDRSPEKWDTPNAAEKRQERASRRQNADRRGSSAKRSQAGSPTRDAAT